MASRCLTADELTFGCVGLQSQLDLCAMKETEISRAIDHLERMSRRA